MNHRSSHLLIVSVLLAGLSGAGCATTQTAEPGVAPPRDLSQPSPARLSDAPGTADGGALITERLDEVEFNDDGTVARHRVRAVEIKTQQAAEAESTLQIPWSPWLEERPVVTATVTTSDGKVFELDPATIDDDPLRETTAGMYSDARVLLVPLPGVRAGATVRYEVHRRSIPSVLTNGASMGFGFSARLESTGTTVRISYPKAMAIKWEQVGEGVDVEESTQDGRHHLTFTSGPSAPMEAPELLAPRALVEPASVYLTVGQSWAQMASTYSDIVEAQLAEGDLAPLAAEATRDLTEGASREETAAALLSWLHNHVRYTGLELADASVIPRSPTQTLSRGFGDCKDQATLLVGLLRAAGLPAHVALLSSRPAADAREGLPALDVFNHAIVHVGGEVPLWIDPTHRYVGVDGLPDRDRGRLALIAAPDTVALTRTPERSATLNTYREVREVYLSDNGPGSALIRQSGEGGEDERLRQVFGDVDLETAQGALEGVISWVFGAEELSDLKVGEAEDLSAPFTVELRLDEAPLAFTDGMEASVVLDESGLFHIDPGLEWLFSVEDPEPRELPLEVFRPYTAVVEYVITPPDGFEPVEMIDDEVIPMGAAQLSRSYQWDGEVMRATLSFTTGPLVHAPEEVTALLDAMQSWEEQSRQIVIFRHAGANLIERGDVAGGLAVFASVAEARPDDAGAWARLARALVDVGMGKAARSAALKAVTLDPESVVAHSTRGYVSLHDEIGRSGAVAMDEAAAAEAYARAVELDPQSVYLRANLAQILEGVAKKSGDEGDFAAAIDAWSWVLRNDNTADELRTLAAASLVELNIRKGSPAAAEGPVEAHAEPNTRAVLMATLLAAQGKPADAEVQLKAYGLGAQERSQVLASICDGLAVARLYDEARATLEQATLGASPDQRVALAQKADFLSHIERHDLSDLKVTVPEDLGPLTLYAFFEADEDLWRPIFHPDFVGEMGSYLSGEQGPASPAESPEAAGFTMDLILSGLSVTKEGSEAGGYRLHQSVKGSGGGSLGPVLYVVKHEGEWRLRADGLHPGEVAEAAEALLTRGDEASARKWLEWAVRDAAGLRGSAEEAWPVEILWRQGYREDVAGMRVLAAAARAGFKSTPDSLARLVEAAEVATSATARQALERAVALAQLELERYEEALATIAQLNQRTGDAAAAARLRLEALAGLDREAEVEALVEHRAADYPDAIDDLIWLANHKQERGELAAAADLWERVLVRRPGQPMALNNRAWLAAFLGEVSEAELRRGRDAVDADEGPDASSLHTLATLLAERGDGDEAMDYLRQTLDARRSQAIEPHDWYVVGRVAEGWGLKEAAREAYTLALADNDNPLSVAVLAQRRLAAMDASSP